MTTATHTHRSNTITDFADITNLRSDALAARLEAGATALGAFATRLSDAEWQARIPHDGRKVGVVLHHVATMYPLEIQLAVPRRRDGSTSTRAGVCPSSNRDLPPPGGLRAAA